MGCVESQNADRDKSCNFTQEERKLLRENWKKLSKNATGTGIQVFMKLMESPEIKQLFRWRYMTEAEMYESELFKGHATRFMLAVGAAVENMDNLNGSLYDLLTDLGRKHNYVEGFESLFFLQFVDATKQVWTAELGAAYTLEAQQAWEKLFVYIKVRMVAGMEENHRLLTSNLHSEATADANHHDVQLHVQDQ